MQDDKWRRNVSHVVQRRLALEQLKVIPRRGAHADRATFRDPLLDIAGRLVEFVVKADEIGHRRACDDAAEHVRLSQDE
jgi:hypothetical protein